ncbi:unnamed protein product, partial [Rangifer tarandus platyrhynchus]
VDGRFGQSSFDLISWANHSSHEKHANGPHEVTPHRLPSTPPVPPPLAPSVLLSAFPVDPEAVGPTQKRRIDTEEGWGPGSPPTPGPGKPPEAMGEEAMGPGPLEPLWAGLGPALLGHESGSCLVTLWRVPRGPCWPQRLQPSASCRPPAASRVPAGLAEVPVHGDAWRRDRQTWPELTRAHFVPGLGDSPLGSWWPPCAPEPGKEPVPPQPRRGRVNDVFAEASGLAVLRPLQPAHWARAAHSLGETGRVREPRPGSRFRSQQPLRRCVSAVAQPGLAERLLLCLHWYPARGSCASQTWPLTQERNVVMGACCCPEDAVSEPQAAPSAPEKPPGTAILCNTCGNVCRGEVLRVQNKYFHIQCFICKACGCDLAEGGFFVRQGEYICTQDYQRLYGTRCFSCDRFIEGEVVSALGKTYHPDCFVCAVCRCSSS